MPNTSTMMPGQRQQPPAGNGRDESFPEELLTDGAALALSDSGEILACAEPLIPPLNLPPSLDHRTVSSLEPAAMRSCLCRLLREVSANHQATAAEFTVAPTGDDRGEPVTLSLRVSPHPNRDGAYLVTVRNVTAYGERMKNLSEVIDALRAQRDEWEAVARTVAHDVRSSLSALVGFVNLALMEPGAVHGSAGEYLDRALDIGTRLITLTDLMVENPSRRSSVRESVDLGVQSSRLFTALQVAHPEVEFTWAVDAGGATVHVSPSALWSLLWGLASNSVRYREPTRTLHIDLRCAHVGGQVWVEVEDNGRGIPTGEEQAIFRPGRRGSNALDVEGSGLGLHGVRLLAEKCGGRVWAEPKEAGALFRLALPLSPTVGGESSSAVPHRSDTGKAAAPPCGKNGSSSRN